MNWTPQLIREVLMNSPFIDEQRRGIKAFGNAGNQHRASVDFLELSEVLQRLLNTKRFGRTLTPREIDR